MAGGPRLIVRTFGGAALIAFLFAGMLAFGGLQEAERCCPKLPLAHVEGPVALAWPRLASGGRYSGLVGDAVLGIRLHGTKTWYRYEDDWPDYDAVKTSTVRGARMDIGYANCRPSAATLTECDAFEIATVGGHVLTRAENVIAARRHYARTLKSLSAVAAGIGFLAAALGLYLLVRAAPAASRL